MGPRRWRVPSERGPDRALTGSGDDEFHRNFALIELAGPRAQLPYAPPRPLPNPAAPCRILLHVCNWKTAFITGRGRNVGSKIDLWTNPCRPKRPFRSRGVARSTRFAREGSLAAPFSLERGRSKRPFRSRGVARSTLFARPRASSGGTRCLRPHEGPIRAKFRGTRRPRAPIWARSGPSSGGTRRLRAHEGAIRAKFRWNSPPLPILRFRPVFARRTRG